MTVRRPRRPGPLRVVVLDHTAALGGGELALLRVCRALGPAVLDLRVVVLDDGPLVSLLREAGVPVLVVPTSARFRSTDRYTAPGSLAGLRALVEAVLLVRRVAAAVRAADADVVHTNSLRADLVGLVAAWLARVPVVWHVHDRIADDYLPKRAVTVLRAVARRFPRAVVANSRATAGTLPGVTDLTVAYPGFAPEQVLAVEERVVPPRPVVGLIGRLSPTKGQIELVRAARAVVDRVPETRFRLVGGALFGADDYAASVEAEIARLGLQDAVEIVGHTQDPAGALDALTVCVHASPVPEPFGQVVVEAMVRAVPVVATDAGGVPEILRPEGEGQDALGLLVPPGDVEALAAAVVEVLQDPRGAQQRAGAAHAAALRRFPVGRTAAVLTDVWTRSAGRR